MKLNNFSNHKIAEIPEDPPPNILPRNKEVDAEK
jgi:hypothetical protein